MREREPKQYSLFEREKKKEGKKNPQKKLDEYGIRNE